MKHAIDLYVRRYEHLRNSELYRGLGIAIAGGLAFSIVLTHTVVSASIAFLN
jgi:multidrug efflux pump subunit AcrB